MEKKTCDKHKKTVEKYDDTIEQLAEDIGDLHYETLYEFLGLLRDKICKDSVKDKNAGRKKLGKALFQAADNIDDAQNSVYRAWIISRPYMQ